MIQSESSGGSQSPLGQQMMRERDWQHLLIITSAAISR
jgi:hypothetical protein